MSFFPIKLKHKKTKQGEEKKKNKSLISLSDRSSSHAETIKPDLRCLLPPKGFPGGSEGKASAGNVGDLSSIPEWGRSLEKEMATHSGTLAWKIPWTEEPGRLQSMGS